MHILWGRTQGWDYVVEDREVPHDVQIFKFKPRTPQLLLLNAIVALQGMVKRNDHFEANMNHQH